MLRTTLTCSSRQTPLSHARLTWWTWRKGATHTQTAASSISSRTVILRSSLSYQYGSSAKMPVMPRSWCDMQSSGGEYGSEYWSIILALALVFCVVVLNFTLLILRIHFHQIFLIIFYKVKKYIPFDFSRIEDPDEAEYHFIVAKTNCRGFAFVHIAHAQYEVSQGTWPPA